MVSKGGGIMNQEIEIELLSKALDLLYSNDQYLISNEASQYVGERCIAHKLGGYLSNLISEYDVDCEFNRDLDTVKKMGGHKIIPDIIIHKRGNNDDNLIVIEVKPWWNDKREGFINDEKKLKYLTNCNNQYRYKYGLSLIINQYREDAKVKIFIDGKTDNIYHKV